MSKIAPVTLSVRIPGRCSAGAAVRGRGSRSHLHSATGLASAHCIGGRGNVVHVRKEDTYISDDLEPRCIGAGGHFATSTRKGMRFASMHRDYETVPVHDVEMSKTVCVR